MNDTPATKSDLQGLEARLVELISAGFETMNERFDRLETQVEKLEVRMDGVELHLRAVDARIRELGRHQREHNDWLQRLDGRLKAFENDVKELYGLAAETRKNFKEQLKKQPEQEKRLRKVEAFARAAARKTGITFS